MTSATDFENDTILSKSLEQSTLLETSINIPTLTGDPKLEATRGRWFKIGLLPDLDNYD